MDENKIVPTPEDEAEKSEENLAPADVEIPDDDGFADSYGEGGVPADEDFLVEEETEDDGELTEDETVEEDKKEAPKKKKKMKLGAKIAIGFLVVLIAFIIFCIVGVYLATKAPSVDFENDAMTVGETNVSAAEFFFYCSGVQGSSVDEIKQGAIDVGILYNTFYAKAKSEGYELSADEKKEIEDRLANIVAAAETAGVSVDKYVESQIADGFTYEMFKEFTEKDAYVNSYYNAKIKEFEDAYKGDAGLEKIEKAYDAKKTDYDVADFSYRYFATTEDGAEDTAKAVAESVKGGQTFDEAVKAVDESITAVTVTTETKASIESSFNADVAAWLYKTDDNGAYVNGTGAVEVFKDDSFVYVVYVNNVPSKNTVKAVTASYIKISVDTDNSVKTEEMNKIVAKKTADKILAEFLATDKSAENLTEIATKYSQENKKVTSSKFDSVVNDGTLDSALENWLFDDARKEKDVTSELIEAEGAYYIVYFESKAENEVWYDTMLNSVVNEDVSSFRDGCLAEGKKNFTVNNDSVTEVMNLISYLSSSSYGY